MKNIQSFIRPNIKELKPYVSARSLCQEEGLIMMDANENPYGDGFRNRYPDPLQENLRKKMATRYQLSSKKVLFGNGSDELIDLLIRVFCEPNKDKITICPPTYGIYEISAQINSVSTNKIPLKENELDVGNILKSPHKILFIPNPNAPTGNLFKKEALENILRNFNGIVVLDEAYVDFSDQASWALRLKEFPNLVILQTFSKYWALAGCRVGMMFASKEIVEVLAKVKSPYNLNDLSAQAALLALENIDSIEKNTKTICEEREKLREKLENFSFIQKVYPSETNFLWVQCLSAWEVCDFVRKEGIVIRKYLDEPDFFRVSIGLPEENEKFINILKKLK